MKDPSTCWVFCTQHSPSTWRQTQGCRTPTADMVLVLPLYPYQRYSFQHVFCHPEVSVRRMSHWLVSRSSSCLQWEIIWKYFIRVNRNRALNRNWSQFTGWHNSLIGIHQRRKKTYYTTIKCAQLMSKKSWLMNADNGLLSNSTSPNFQKSFRRLIFYIFYQRDAKRWIK